jgi:hypothetical protein
MNLTIMTQTKGLYYDPAFNAIGVVPTSEDLHGRLVGFVESTDFKELW